MNEAIIYQILALWAIAVAIIFRRTWKNLYVLLFYNKSFAVCHVRKSATRKAVIHYVVPDVANNYLTRVAGKKTYQLNPDNMAYRKKGRGHFILNEEDSMPLKFREIELVDENIIYKHGDRIYFKSDDKGKALKLEPRTDDDYIIGADRVDQGMYSKSLRILHGPEDKIAFYIALVAVLIALGAAIYSVYSIGQIMPLVQTIYEKVTPDMITITGK
jgi:hypothetical protein